MVDYMPEGTNIVPQGAVEPGMYIVPTYVGGLSPLAVELTIVASPGTGAQVVTEFALKTDDGEIIKGTFSNEIGGLRMAKVSHVYKYAQGNSQYYGHTFYPDVTVKTAAGAVKTMNHNHQKACSVWVKDPAYTADQ
jgi:hypothetical protein